MITAPVCYGVIKRKGFWRSRSLSVQASTNKMGFEVIGFIILVSAAPVAVSSALVNIGERQHD